MHLLRARHWGYCEDTEGPALVELTFQTGSNEQVRKHRSDFHVVAIPMRQIEAGKEIESGSWGLLAWRDGMKRQDEETG